MVTPKPIVLVVDDNEQKRYSVAHYLRSAGYVVWEAMTGAEALRLAEDQPSVITLDVKLPDMVGYEVSKRLRANPKTAGIPIIHISSTFTSVESRARGLDCGADAYLTGPVEREELIATVNAMLRMRHAEVTARNLGLQWQTTFDAISDAVVVINPAGIVERCNKAFALLVGGDTTSVIGRPLTEVAGGSASIDQTVYFRMLSSRRRESIDRQCNNRWYAITADPIFGADGAFNGGVLILSDISARKQVEEALQQEQEKFRRESHQLEQQCAERIRQMEQQLRRKPVV